MSDEVNIGHSPNHFIVLDAISRGINNIDKISRVSKLSKDEVEQIVKDLVFQRLVIRNEKRGFLGRKKIELKITETGSSLLDYKKMFRKCNSTITVETNHSWIHLWFQIEHGCQ